MKTHFGIWLAAAFMLGGVEFLHGTPGLTGLQTNVPPPTPYAIVTNSADSRMWARTNYEVLQSGKSKTNIQSYVELTTGLNHRVGGRWIASSELIDILPNGTAVATNGQHQAYFPGDIYSGQIRLVTADGVQMRSRPLGLSYFDGTNSVLIAELTNSIGVVSGSNVVIYPDAFTDIKADIRYTYTKAGLEQDIVLKQRPPTPASFGLNPQTTRLQMLTEYFNTADPAQTATPVNKQDGLSDRILAFGKMKMMRGKAFVIGNPSQSNSVPVYKSWQHLEGRTFLVEEVPLGRVAGQLESLPQTAMGTDSGKASHMASTHLVLPRQRLAQTGEGTVHLARADVAYKSGVVLDYVEVNSSQTNFTFQGDTTYLVDGSFYLYDTTTFEGGTVIKCDINGQINIDYGGTINCQTAAYLPAIFTSVNDNGVGESMGDSPDPYYTGSPSFTDVNTFLAINCSSPVLSHMRFSYAQAAITSGVGIDIWDSQFENVSNCLAATGINVGLHNVLIQEVAGDYPFYLHTSGNFIGENVTCDGFEGGNGLVHVDNPGTQTVALTNCIVTSGQYVSVNGGTFAYSANPIYQSAAAGNYYLTNGSPYRSVGTTNISPALLADLGQKTTWPPMVYAGVNFTNAMTLSPQVPRDTNTIPDLGYHYDPLDYVFGGCVMMTNLTVTAGTAVGIYQDESEVFYTSGQSFGLFLNYDGVDPNLVFNGNVEHPCIFSMAYLAQDGLNGSSCLCGSWCGSGYGSIVSGQVSATFLKCYSLHSVYGLDGAGSFTNCEFYNVFMANVASTEIVYDSGVFNFVLMEYSGDEYYGSITESFGPLPFCFQNCLLSRSDTESWSDGSFTIQNCTFMGGDLEMARTDSNAVWLVRNTAFDGTYIPNYDGLGGDTNYTTFDYNAYLSGAGTLEIVGAHDLTNIVRFNWQSSWLGDYYQPTNILVDAGSTNANLLGLYHYTTQTNQMPETNSIVDIGYHYVATDAYGNPLDVNSDGVPDYLEDANGNGLVDDGETNWALAILTQPASQTVVQGSNATFTITASGVVPLTYQWWFDGTNIISGATNSSLILTNIQSSQAGSYAVIVTNLAGDLTSSNASLTVLVPVPPTISITNPISGSIIIGTSTNITLMAAASDSVGVVTQVQFFQGATSLGIVTNTPYNLVWSNAMHGIYTLVACATDNYGLTSTSSVVNLNIFLAPEVLDFGFELPVAGTANQIETPTGTAWSYTGNSGVADNGVATNVDSWLAVQTPQGNQAAFLNNTATISQSVWFTNGVYVDGTYRISFISSPDGTSDGGDPFNVTVDGVTVGSFYPTNSGYSNFVTSPFVVSEGDHTIAFIGTGTGPQTSMIDDIIINDLLPAPPNDNFANAQTISLGGTTGTNLNAILESGETGLGGGHTVWYKYVASNDGWLAINASGAYLQPVIGLGAGLSYGGWNGDKITGTNTVVGYVHATWADYYICIDGVSPEETGFFNLNASYTNEPSVSIGTFTTTNLLLWLKADAITGLTNDAGVDIWADNSGFGNDATQSDSSSQPLYITNGLNGYPVVHFNGTNTYFDMPDVMYGTTGAEAFVVLKAATNLPSGQAALWRWGASTAEYPGPAYPNSSGQIVESFGSTAQYNIGVPAQPLNQYHVYEVAGYDGDWLAWINGQLQAEVPGNSYGIWSPYYSYTYALGRDSFYTANYFSGDVAEVLVFNRPLTGDERTGVNEYLNSKYGLVPMVPAAPTNLVAQAVSPTQIGLTWNEVFNQGATLVSVERKTGSAGTYAPIAQLSEAASYVDTNLTAETTYYYRIRAINLSSWSAYSNETNATTLPTGADIPLGNLLLWLKADSGLTQIGTNTPVNLWADQSGNGYNGTQSTGTNQPLWMAGALNGYPVVHFNGTNTYFDMPDVMYGTTGAEAFVVLKAATNLPSGQAALWRWGASTAEYPGPAYPNSSGQIVESFGSTAQYNIGVPAQPLNQYHVYEVAGYDGDWLAWINGQLQAEVPGNSYGIWSPYYSYTYALGRDSFYTANYFSGDVAEVLVFNRPLTGDERIAAGGYLVSKYNLSQYATNSSPPETPTNLVAMGVSPSELNLQWTQGSTNTTVFDVQRKLGSGGTYQEIGSPSGTTNFLDSTVCPTNQYFYQVKAINYFGQSGYSTEISPPVASLTVISTNGYVITGSTNLLAAQASDAYSTINRLQIIGGLNTNDVIGTGTSAFYTNSWTPSFSTIYAFNAVATDALGNSRYAATLFVTSYLDSNGDGIPDYLQVLQGNDPLNPWIPPSGGTNNVPPNIFLRIPTNAVLLP